MSVKGLGSCLIAQENGYPCGKQILEGEPIDTVVSASGPILGHQRCAAGFKGRQRQEQEDKMVKIGRQKGPGGSIGNPKDFPDGIIGSIPLEKPEPPVLDVEVVEPPKIPWEEAPVTVVHDDQWTDEKKAEVEAARQRVLARRTPAPIPASSLPPPEGWTTGDFPELSVALVPYVSNPVTRADPMITVTTEGHMFIELGNVRLGLANQANWKKLVDMGNRMYNQHLLTLIQTNEGALNDPAED